MQFSSLTLLPGKRLLSDNGAFSLTFHEDGNLVLRQLMPPAQELWKSGHKHPHRLRCVFQTDGNLVAYGKSDDPKKDDVIFFSGSDQYTGRNPTIALEDTGDLVIRADRTLWSNNAHWYLVGPWGPR